MKYVRFHRRGFRKRTSRFRAEFRAPLGVRKSPRNEPAVQMLRLWGFEILGFQPGKPQQNAYVERYNRTVRHEWPDQHIIESIEEAQDYATQWLWTYNNERPNMALGGITPAEKLKLAA
jgi:putative transposase